MVQVLDLFLHLVFLVDELSQFVHIKKILNFWGGW